MGTDQVSLYDEPAARGFDLQSSGAYRIEDAYSRRSRAHEEPKYLDIHFFSHSARPSSPDQKLNRMPPLIEKLSISEPLLTLPTTKPETRPSCALAVTPSE